MEPTALGLDLTLLIVTNWVKASVTTNELV